MRRRKKGDPPVGPPEPDGEVHVPSIMNADPLIFPPKLKLAIEHYLNTSPRNRETAAKLAGMDPDEFDRHFHVSPGVRAYIKEQEEAIDKAAAETLGKARALNAVFLDSHTVALLDSKDTPPGVKATVLTTGYKRFGMLKEKSEVSGVGGAPLAFHLVRIGGKKDTDDDAPSADR